MAKKIDYKTWNIGDLEKEVGERREALRAFRFGGEGSRTRNVREGRSLRKTIARLLTEINSRTISD